MFSLPSCGQLLILTPFELYPNAIFFHFGVSSKVKSKGLGRWCFQVYYIQGARYIIYINCIIPRYKKTKKKNYIFIRSQIAHSLLEIDSYLLMNGIRLIMAFQKHILSQVGVSYLRFQSLLPSSLPQGGDHDFDKENKLNFLPNWVYWKSHASVIFGWGEKQVFPYIILCIYRTLYKCIYKLRGSITLLWKRERLKNTLIKEHFGF